MNSIETFKIAQKHLVRCKRGPDPKNEIHAPGIPPHARSTRRLGLSFLCCRSSRVNLYCCGPKSMDPDVGSEGEPPWKKRKKKSDNGASGESATAAEKEVCI